ncbi:dihydroxyacetone kinase phosphoryl donor subunit DhaM [Gracilibacillus alcaliphilus]|uniref:dihydroxyacetone kinase phosphoryl donor subunit DhaM n=1 Tax=Gracilibacillus alcaliphilus TaxID=1401441 RepID=UPI00195D5E25|nr:dihydroxyacetone kinase phosphoryl donor subunit DhaM [Gracilibacillus alcaliphilus]MBM7676404.1 dihydroxyacetone kinase phosphotransfer subunit [Gracilibacillus alcaliphilus]
MSGKVGIVIISHSPEIAKGIHALINQVIEGVPVAEAAGTDDGEIGTSMEKILLAIETVDQGQGVLMFYDLGSAKMNAEMALEFTEAADVRIADHVAIVEGTYVAAVESSIGKTLDDIVASLERLAITEM